MPQVKSALAALLILGVSTVESASAQTPYPTSTPQPSPYPTSTPTGSPTPTPTAPIAQLIAAPYYKTYVRNSFVNPDPQFSSANRITLGPDFIEAMPGGLGGNSSTLAFGGNFYGTDIDLDPFSAATFLASSSPYVRTGFHGIFGVFDNTYKFKNFGLLKSFETNSSTYPVSGTRVLDVTYDLQGNRIFLGLARGNAELFGQGYSFEVLDGSKGVEHGFIAKVDPTGNLLWLRSLMLTTNDRFGNWVIPYDVDVDPQTGTIAVTGTFSGEVYFHPEQSIKLKATPEGAFIGSYGEQFVTLIKSDGTYLRTIDCGPSLAGGAVKFAPYSSKLFVINTPVKTYTIPNTSQTVKILSSRLLAISNLTLVEDPLPLMLQKVSASSILHHQGMTFDGQGDLYVSGVYQGELIDKHTKKILASDSLNTRHGVLLRLRPDYAVYNYTSIAFRWSKKLNAVTNVAPVFDASAQKLLVRSFARKRLDINPDAGVDLVGEEGMDYDFLSVFSADGDYFYSTPIATGEYSHTQALQYWGKTFVSALNFDHLTTVARIATSVPNLPDFSVTGIKLSISNGPPLILSGVPINTALNLDVLVANRGILTTGTGSIDVYLDGVYIPNASVIRATMPGIITPVRINVPLTITKKGPHTIKVNVRSSDTEFTNVNNEYSYNIYAL